jgi:hypothetical protein
MLLAWSGNVPVALCDKRNGEFCASTPPRRSTGFQCRARFSPTGAISNVGAARRGAHAAAGKKRYGCYPAKKRYCDAFAFKAACPGNRRKLMGQVVPFPLVRITYPDRTSLLDTAECAFRIAVRCWVSGYRNDEDLLPGLSPPARTMH